MAQGLCCVVNIGYSFVMVGVLFCARLVLVGSCWVLLVTSDVLLVVVLCCCFELGMFYVVVLDVVLSVKCCCCFCILCQYWRMLYVVLGCG